VSRSPRNWAGNIVYDASTIHRPSSVDELRRLVAAATEDGGRIRALGTGHSFSSVADTRGALVLLDGLPPTVEVAADRCSATVPAGMTYAEVATRLQAAGLALRNLGSLPHISVAGAVATGTHGSGDANGGLGTAVVAVEMVTAGGELVRLEPGSPGFAGSVVALGALGIVTRLTLSVEPTYDVAQVVYEGLRLDDLDIEVFANGYSVSVFLDWASPTATQVWVKQRVRRPVLWEVPEDWRGAHPADGPRHPISGISPDACTVQGGVPGPWHERLPHFRPEFTPSAGAELQSEFFLPRPALREALDALAPLADRIAPVLAVCELRTVAADELWLSPAYGRDSVTVHFTWHDDLAGVLGVLPAIEERLVPLGARPHWGKVFTIGADEVGAGYEMLAEFGKLRRQFDPGGVFGNDFVDAFVPLPD
jgi:xylitol oxidase